MVATQRERFPSHPNVDESLFGTRGQATHRSGSSRNAGKAIAAAHVVSKADLRRMKGEAVIVTEQKLAEMQLQKEKELEITREISMKRKKKMIEKELREHREKLALEGELEAEKAAHLSESDKVQHQHLDSVKRINSLAQRASAFMVREEQIRNKEDRAHFEKAYSRHFEDRMEVDRVNELARRREQNEIDREKRIEARRMLEVQIAERERLKIREEEAKALEAQKIIEKYKKYEKEDQEKVEARREHVRRTVIEVAKTNAQIKEMKIKMKERERRDELVAAMYLRKKAKEEEIKFKEEERLKVKKEERTAKLRAQQEKVQDKRAAQDELRAKRAYEAKEMAARQKAKDEIEWRRTNAQYILSERKKQEEFKRAQRNSETLSDKRAADRARRQAEEENARRREVAKLQHEEKMKYQASLNRQIADNEQKRERESVFQQAEGALGKKKILKEKIVVDKIRKETIQRLRREGVKDQYLVELMQEET